MAASRDTSDSSGSRVGEVDINLFAGAGGLALGLMEAGFSPSYYYEIDKHACETLRHNIESQTPTLSGTVEEGDVRDVDWGKFAHRVRLLAGGVPCQPFSLAGKHKAQDDERNCFPDALRAIRELRPAIFLLENVRGLLRRSFQPYFDYIIRQLEVPSAGPRSRELWQSHDDRIRRHQCSIGYCSEYRVSWRLVDAADYGIPQNRCRVFIVGTRIDLPAFRFPDRTHSRDSLLREQTTGGYWQERGLNKPKRLPGNGMRPAPKPDGVPAWSTVRDGLAGLAEPAASQDADDSLNHWRIHGARLYAGHKGSVFDWPSKTIKAGVHGVPGGENIVIPNGRKLRYYTLRETARLQTFPDEHYFKGARLHVTRQIGNAVPCHLAAVIAAPLRAVLRREREE